MISLFLCVPWNIQHDRSRSAQLLWNAHASLSVYLFDLRLSRKPSSRAQTGGWTWQWSWSPAETAPPAGRVQRDLKTLEDNQRKECNHNDPSSSLQVCFHPATVSQWYYLNIIRSGITWGYRNQDRRTENGCKMLNISVACKMFPLFLAILGHLSHFSQTNQLWAQ